MFCILRRLAAVPVVVLFAGLAGCGGGSVTDEAARPASPAPPTPSGITLASADAAGLTLEGVALVRVAVDIVELRADLVNRGAAVADIGGVVAALSGPAGPRAPALATTDGEKRLYPLVPVTAAGGGRDDVGSLAPGARRPIVVRFGPVASDVERLTFVFPGFAPSPPLPIAETK